MYYYLFENATPTTLSEEELILIEKLFQQMKAEYNAGQAIALTKHNQENPENQLDGGNCFYNFKVNLTTKAVYDLQINGYA